LVPLKNALKDKLLGVFPCEFVIVFGWFEGDATSGFRRKGKLPITLLASVQRNMLNAIVTLVDTNHAPRQLVQCLDGRCLRIWLSAPSLPEPASFLRSGRSKLDVRYVAEPRPAVQR
jgi:hypothetical protein